MKKMTFVLLLIANAICISDLSAQVTTEDRKHTLGEARSLLVGKKIVILGTISRIFPGRVDTWQYARSDDGAYLSDSKPGDIGYISESYLGQEAEVVAVLRDSLKSKPATTNQVNAFGEKSNDDALIDPYCTVIARMADGKLVYSSTYVSMIFSKKEPVGSFKLLSTLNEQSAIITNQLPAIVGKTVYAVRNSRLYRSDASLESMLSEPESYNQDRAVAFPKLQPLTIAAAKYVAGKDAILIKLKDATGTEYLVLCRYKAADPKNSFLTNVVTPYPATLFVAIPTLSPKELQAIRGGSIVVGMSEKALHYSIGFPDKENEWSRGQRQLIYADGKRFVYLDANDRVVDWQSF